MTATTHAIRRKNSSARDTPEYYNYVIYFFLFGRIPTRAKKEKTARPIRIPPYRIWRPRPLGIWLPVVFIDRKINARRCVNEYTVYRWEVSRPLPIALGNSYIIAVAVMSLIVFIANCVWSEPPIGPAKNGLRQIDIWLLRYSCIAKPPTSHFPHTIDTHLDFNSEISESDFVDA